MSKKIEDALDDVEACFKRLRLGKVFRQGRILSLNTKSETAEILNERFRNYFTITAGFQADVSLVKVEENVGDRPKYELRVSVHNYLRKPKDREEAEKKATNSITPALKSYRVNS